MSVLAGRRTRANGELRAGTDGASRPRRRAERDLRSRRSARERHSEFSPLCRGPPSCADLGDEKDRVRGPVFQHIRAYPARHKNQYGECSRVADGSATGM